jgi:hypothetical protein
MTYAHARASGDGSLISRYVRTRPVFILPRANNIGQYSLLTSWADYLSDSTLLIHGQCVLPTHPYCADNLNDRQHRSSADGLTVDNQTNLAIKGIIAIQAMSKMSSVVKQAADAEKYNVRADVVQVLRRN